MAQKNERRDAYGAEECDTDEGAEGGHGKARVEAGVLGSDPGLAQEPDR